MGMTVPHLRRVVLLALLCAGAALGVGVMTAAPASAGPACAGADATIDDPADTLRQAMICLINSDRAEHDRHSLDPNGKLSEAARKHNKVMLEENCWGHDCPGEPNLGKRLRDTGYLRGAKRWRYAENIGCANTPQALFDAWVGNEFARKNIRNGVFRDIGIGVLKDQVGASGCDDGNQITYTVVFARRKG